MSLPSNQPIRVAFLFLGGAHQMLHTAPVAAELSRDPRFAVTCLISSTAQEAVIDRLTTAWPDARLQTETLPAPGWSHWLARLAPRFKAMKVPRLIANRRRLQTFDAIVTAERTSTLLKRLHLFAGQLIHIPHGAGDRAKGFEPRIRLFDLVIVSGQKDADRMIAEKLVAPDRCHVSGSVKLGAVARLSQHPPRFFDNDRPVVLYNPHFSRELGSWAPWGMDFIRAFASETDMNLIVAPHVRLLEGADAAERSAIAALAVPGRVLVDTGSSRSFDMSYTMAADIYVGDVSSQIYEFLSRPRPCVLLNAHGVAWQNDPNYAFWHLGEVVDRKDAILAAINHAQARHPDFRAAQECAVTRAMGEGWPDAPARAAGFIRDFLTQS